MEFRLLGGIEAHRRGHGVDMGHARQQCVLAVLLVEANTAVSADELIDRVWAAHPPRRSTENLHSYLTRLRRILADDDADIVRHGNSYQVTVDESRIDLHRFRQLIGAARIAPDNEAAVLLERALDLWCGEPFAGLDTPWLHGMRVTLGTELDHTDLELRLGHHTRLLAPLAARAGQFPLDEELAGQSMLAPYRSGGQADALTHYHDTRRQLDAELGVQPAPALRELHHRILANDPRLAVPQHALPHEQPGTPRPDSALPIPRQLPPAPGTFTGRGAEFDGLTTRLDTAKATVRISVIAGAGGIGKTWLALHWAHRNTNRFPDGQLFVNLRGFDPSGKPISLQDAVRGFLEALGVAPAAIPVALDAQVGLYRSLVADRRLLIVVDNAANTAQVTPLLPGSHSCTVLVTSRDRLTSLVAAHDACPVPLDVLPESDARELLTARLGEDRIADEPDALADLPLALSIVAGRAQEHPEFPLASIAAELHDTTHTALHALERASLIHLYAQEQTDTLPDTVLRRLVEFYLHTAWAADMLLDPLRENIELDPPAPGCQPLTLPSIPAAMAWFDAEHPCLIAAQQVAAQQNWPRMVWQFAWVLTSYRRLRGHTLDNLAAWRAALTADQTTGESGHASLTHRRLGQSYDRADRPADALRHLSRALSIAERDDDRFNHALAHHALGLVRERQGKDDKALANATEALLEGRALNSVGWFAARTGRYEQGCRRGLTLARHNRDLIGEADRLHALGYLARRTADFGAEIEYFQQAIAGYRNVANTHDEATCLEELGNVHAELRSRPHAMAAWQAAAVLYQAYHRGTDSARAQRQLASLDDNHSAPGPRRPTPTRA